MDTLKKYGTKLAIVAGAAATVAGLIYYFGQEKKEDTKKEESIESDNLDFLSKLEKANILAGIKITRDGEFLSLQTISQINDAVIKFAIPAFVKLTQEDRAARRSNMDDLTKYVALWDEYTKKLEEIIDASQKEVLKGLNMGDDDWEKSNSYYISTNNQELFMLHATLPQRLKSAVKSQKSLSLEEFKTIMRAQIKILNEQTGDMLKELSNIVHSPEEIPPVIQNKIHDILYQEYNVEEEDVISAVQGYLNDPEVQQLLMQIQQATMRMMPMPEGMF